MINAIYLISRLKKEGPSNQALNLLKSFDKAKIHSVIVTLSPERADSSMLSVFKERGVEVIQLNRGISTTILCLFDLIKIVRQRNIQIIHSSGLRPDIISVLLPIKKIRKCTTQRCSPEDILNVVSSRALAWFYVLFIRRFDKIIACSKSLAKIIYDKYALPCEYVRNGVDVDFYHPISLGDKIALRKKFDLPDDKRIFVAIGSLILRKNVINIITAFNTMNASDKFLLIVGDGSQLRELKQCVRVENVRFVGQQNNPLEYIQLADVMISSSFAEGLPNSVLEGLACGLPVLLSDITPHLEIFDIDHRMGELFPNETEEGLVAAIRCTDVWDLKEKKEIVRSVAVNQLSRECTARAYEAKYESLIKG